jgi:RNA polymerase sigma-70 factor, ECF subfamily
MLAMALPDDVSALAILARRLCGNRHDADDLVQDTLERALRARGRYLEQGSRFNWLAVILRNRFRDRYKASRRARPSDALDEIPMPEVPEPEPWERITPADLDAAIAQLPEVFREVCELHARGCSYADIANELGISINTFGTRLLRARVKLKAILAARVC